MREYDKRLRDLDEHMSKMVAETSTGLRRRMEDLEKIFKNNLEVMINRLNAEHLERRIGVEEMVRRLAEATNVLELKIENLDQTVACKIPDLPPQLFEEASVLKAEARQTREQIEDASRQIQDLRQQLSEQSSGLKAEINEIHEQMQVRVDREMEQIRGAIIKREALAEMLSEVALRQRLTERFQAAAA